VGKGKTGRSGKQGKKEGKVKRLGVHFKKEGRKKEGE